MKVKMEELKQYELLKQERIADICADGYLLRHKKSGARILALLNDDENKVFHITFRTIPEDSTGVAHILEHSVLCGSRKYPVKDPFVELVKGSLNTFLNAMTYPDKTMYPLASCNDQDFRNLMEVYLDAVFYPNIYQREEIFRQEGWSYQLETPEDEIQINGVVYNEMKGAFSSPEDVLEREIMNSLFPDTVYGVESGGDPDCIPELGYEAFLDFHRKYYHPSNSYIYFYGDIDLTERLQWLDREYLNDFDACDIDSQICLQQPFPRMRRVTRSYPVSDADPLENQTYLSCNAVVSTGLDVELSHAFAVLEYVLLTAPGAKLKQALLDAGIGKDILSDYSSGIYQPYFSIIAKNADGTDADRFLQVIRDTLSQIVKEGIDKKALYAGINSMEFKFREADYGAYPKGLMYGIDVFDSWLYDEMEPFAYLKQLRVYEALKEYAQGDYFERLISAYLLDNPHSSLVILEPERGMTQKKEEETRRRLQAWKASLSETQLQELVEQTQKLRRFQETPDPQEQLQKLPMLERSDIGRSAAPLQNETLDWDGVRVICHDLFTNGIAYVDLLFDCEGIQAEDLPYLGILKSVVGMVDTENFSYGDLNHDINSNTGGISAGLSTFHTPDEKGYRAFFGIRSRVLYEKLPYAMKMSAELLTSKPEDDKRLYEILAKLCSRLSMQFSAAGHQAAAGRALSYFSKHGAFSDAVSGIAFYDVIEDLEKNFEQKKELLKEKLRGLMDTLFCRARLMISVTADGTGLQLLREAVSSFITGLPAGSADPGETVVVTEKKNEGFMTPAQVQYVARAGNFAAKGFAYTGTLRILKVLMSYDYLWTNIRVKGGAYGCMCSFGRSGSAFFVSYRDPNLVSTNQVYEKIPEYLESFDADEREMTKFILGAIGELDTPLPPASRGARSLNAYFSGVTMEQLQQEREEILNCTPGQIRALSPLVQAVLDEEVLCVVGNESRICEARELFSSVRRLGVSDDAETAFRKEHEAEDAV